jgi:transcriptional regulator of acetoin/glycerol metabolism
VEETYMAWGAPLKQLDPDTMPQLDGNSMPGFYRGPRGGVVEVTDWGTQRRWQPLTAGRPESRRQPQLGGSVRSHVTALERWAQVYRQRDDLIRAASAAGVGVNEIARITGIAKTTVIRVLRR